MRLPILLLNVGCMTSVIHASTWLTVSSSRFEIVSDAGEAVAREVVTCLEQFDGAIAHSAALSPAFAAVAGPLKIYLFRNEKEFAEFRNDDWTSGLTVTPGNHVPTVVALFAGPAQRETAIHEYVHALVRRGDWKLPRWFEEGLAEFYSKSSPIRKGDRLSIGQRIPEHLAQLKHVALTPSLFAQQPQADNHSRYYAASWAMVHMLLMEPRLRSTTEKLLADGDGWDEVFPDLLKSLRDYLDRPLWKELTVDAPKSEQQLIVSPIAPLDAEFMLATLLLDVNRTDAARQRYKRIIAAHPKDAAGAEASAFLALSSGQKDVARTEFQRALRLGSTRSRVWSEAASLNLDAGAAWGEAKLLLERAVSLDPSDYQPAFLLGVRENDEGNFTQAVDYLAKATRAAPERVDVWHAYASALSKAGRLDEARSAARWALRVASSPEWERMASDLLESLDHVTPTGARRKPEVLTSQEWSRPTPDAQIEGLLVEFVCEASRPRLKVEGVDGKIVELNIADPKQVTIVDPSSDQASIELTCGTQYNRPIRVGFRKIDSTVLEIKFPQVHDSKRF